MSELMSLPDAITPRGQPRPHLFTLEKEARSDNDEGHFIRASKPKPLADELPKGRAEVNVGE